MGLWRASAAASPPSLLALQSKKERALLWPNPALVQQLLTNQPRPTQCTHNVPSVSGEVGRGVSLLCHCPAISACGACTVKWSTCRTAEGHWCLLAVQAARCPAHPTTKPHLHRLRDATIQTRSDTVVVQQHSRPCQGAAAAVAAAAGGGRRTHSTHLALTPTHTLWGTPPLLAAQTPLPACPINPWTSLGNKIKSAGARSVANPPKQSWRPNFLVASERRAKPRVQALLQVPQATETGAWSSLYLVGNKEGFGEGLGPHPPFCRQVSTTDIRVGGGAHAQRVLRLARACV
jgi:hypothetical protein